MITQITINAAMSHGDNYKRRNVPWTRPELQFGKILEYFG